LTTSTSDSVRPADAQPYRVTDAQPYRVTDAMRVLRMSRTVIYDQIRTGRLRSVKQGRARLITPAAIRAYIALLERKPRKQPDDQATQQRRRRPPLGRQAPTLDRHPQPRLRSSGKTKTEAKNKLKEVLRDYEDGLAIAPADYTVERAVKD
jgi:hypothetical protein